MEWLEPWFSTEGLPDLAAAYERQLRSEIGPGHPLHGVPIAAVGKDGGRDDVVFSVLDGCGRVAVVHLTWSQSPDQRYWPAAEFFPSLEAFAEQRMRPDHAEYESE